MNLRLSLVCLLAAISVGAADVSRPLSDRLLSPNSKELTAALLDLARSGPTSRQDIERARAGLVDMDPVVRQAAMTAVTAMRDDGSVQTLAGIMSSGSPAERQGAHDALVALAGSDAGGGDGAAWDAWDGKVAEETTAGISRVQEAVAANDIEKARGCLHPLLMQRAGRDLVVEMLSQIAAGDDPRLAALAREGLSAIDTAYAHLVLADVQAAIQQAAEAAAVAQAAPRRERAVVTVPAAIATPAPVSGNWLVILAVASLAGVGGVMLVLRRTRPTGGKPRDWTRVFVINKGKKKTV